MIWTVKSLNLITKYEDSFLTEFWDYYWFHVKSGFCFCFCFNFFRKIMLIIYLKYVLESTKKKRIKNFIVYSVFSPGEVTQERVRWWWLGLWKPWWKSLSKSVSNLDYDLDFYLGCQNISHITDISPFQDYSHLDDQTTQSYITPWFKWLILQ